MNCTILINDLLIYLLCMQYLVTRLNNPLLTLTLPAPPPPPLQYKTTDETIRANTRDTTAISQYIVPRTVTHLENDRARYSKGFRSSTFFSFLLRYKLPTFYLDSLPSLLLRQTYTSINILGTFDDKHDRCMAY